MAHSDSYPYPLPFPSEAQRTQISSYSSLANALGTDPGWASRQRRRLLPENRDAITDTQAINVNRPPVSNPSCNVLNPGTHHARTLLSVANGRSTSNAGVVCGDNSDQKDLPRFLSCYQAGPEFPAIHFVRKEDKEPYSVWDLLTMDTMPNLVAGNLPILIQGPDRWIKIKLIWPGYSRYPFEKRIPIKRGAPFTPTLLLMTLAHHIVEFARWIKNEGAVVEPGQEHWTIMGAPQDHLATWKDCVITSLEHRTGSVWQPEIYYPRG